MSPCWSSCRRHPKNIAKAIGEHIADLIENESTIQTGVGKIPNSVFPYLMNKRDLGIHTETFTEGLIDLIEAGVITCRKKSLASRKDRLRLLHGYKTAL